MANKNSNNNSNNKDKGNSSQSQNGGGLNSGNKPKFNIYWIYILIGLSFFAIQYLSMSSKPLKTTFTAFEKMMLDNDVKRVVLINNQQKVEIYIKDEKLKDPKYKALDDNSFMNSVSKSGPHYVFTIGTTDGFEKQMKEINDKLGPNKVELEYDFRKDIFGDLLAWVLPIVIIVAFWLFIFRRMSGGAGGGAGNIFNVGKSRAQIFDKETTAKIDFKDVAGLEEAKLEIKEIVDFLKKPKKYTELGGKIPKGALLVGPPGTGKTLLAKAVAGEANVPFFSISGSDFVEMFVGVGASRVRDLFKQAKEKAPCIIFIDEIDAIGRARGRNPNFGANDERENTLNQLLTEMDGFATNTGVIILAATNRADILDRALLRAGRFDRQIHVELPDVNERKEIFRVHLRPIKFEKDLDIDFLSRQTPGFSGADIANVCNEAALIAARKDKKQVEKQDFLDAIDRIVGGLEKKNKIISLAEKKTIAYHEAGHATISWMLEHASPLVKVTIIPRGKSLGAAWYLPEERQITTTEQMMDEMVATLGGRAAEDIVFGKISTGALNDLERVTKQAYAMVAYFGMSEKIGNISYYDSTGQSEYAFTKPYSDKTSEAIDKEVNELIDRAYNKAKEVLQEYRDGLERLAKQLLEKEVIFSEDLEIIFGKRKFAIPSHEDVSKVPTAEDAPVETKTDKNEEAA